MKTTNYVDGFVVPVPKKNLDRYREVASKCGEIWKEYGALEYIECVAEDAKTGKLTSFPQSVMMTEDETVVFSWIVYKSKEDRDTIVAKVMDDPRLSAMEKDIFDGKRMIYGGFKPIVTL